MNALNPAVLASPAFLAHSYEPAGDMALLVRLTEAQIAAASFLDQRLLQPGAAAEWIGWDSLGPAVAGLPEELDLIFHLGHVGSTLLARLLGGHPSVLSLREPAAFRSLAALHAEIDTPESLLSSADFDERLGGFLKLWSRTFRPDQRALVKATSFCAEMAADILDRPAAARAIFMTARPEAYMATILGGENNHMDIRANAAGRLRRLHRRLGEPAWRLSEMSYGEMVAMSYAAELASLAAAERGERTLWVDFDDLLAAPEAELVRAFSHFGRSVSPAEIAALAQGPDMRRYAKAPEHAYDADLRRAVLDQARALHGDALRQGLAWLDAAASTHELIGKSLMRCG